MKRAAAAMDAAAAAMIKLELGDGTGDAVTMPREVACAQSDTLAGLLEDLGAPPRGSAAHWQRCQDDIPRYICQCGAPTRLAMEGWHVRDEQRARPGPGAWPLLSTFRLCHLRGRCVAAYRVAALPVRRGPPPRSDRGAGQANRRRGTHQPTSLP